MDEALDILRDVQRIGEAVQPWGVLIAAAVGAFTILNYIRTNRLSQQKMDFDLRKQADDSAYNSYSKSLEYLTVEASTSQKIVAINLLRAVRVLRPQDGVIIRDALISLIKNSSKLPVGTPLQTHFKNRSEDIQLMFDTVFLKDASMIYSKENLLDMKYVVLAYVSLFRSSSTIEYVDFSHASLFGCISKRGSITSSYFSKSSLTGGFYVDVKFFDVTFVSTTFSEIEFVDCSFENCRFLQCSGSMFINHRSLTNCTFIDCDFSKFIVDSVEIKGCIVNSYKGDMIECRSVSGKFDADDNSKELIKYTDY